MEAINFYVGDRFRNKHTGDILEVKDYGDYEYLFENIATGDTYDWVDEDLYDEIGEAYFIQIETCIEVDKSIENKNVITRIKQRISDFVEEQLQYAVNNGELPYLPNFEIHDR